LTAKAEKTPLARRSLVQKLLLLVKTASDDTLFIKGSEHLPEKDFKVLLPPEHLQTKKFCVNGDVSNLIPNSINPHILTNPDTFEQYLKGPGEEEWRKIQSENILSAEGEPVWNEWGNTFGMGMVPDGKSEMKWKAPSDQPNKEFLISMAQLWYEFATRGLRVPEPIKGAKYTLTNVTGITPYGPVSVRRPVVKILLNFEIICKAAISFEYHNDRLDAYSRDCLGFPPKQPDRVLTQAAPKFRLEKLTPEYLEKMKAIREKKEADRMAKIKDSLSPFEKQLEEQMLQELRAREGNSGTSEADFEDQNEETYDENTSQRSYTGSNAKTQGNDNVETASTTPSLTSEMLRQSNNEETVAGALSGALRPLITELRQSKTLDRQTTPGKRVECRIFSLGVPEDREYILSLFEGPGIPKLPSVNAFKGSFPKFISESKSEKPPLNRWLNAMAMIILSYDLCQTEVMTRKYEYLDESCLDQVTSTGDLSWRSMVTTLMSNYYSVTSIYNAQLIFMESVQSQDESASEYLRRLRKLGNDCNIPNNHETIRIRFFAGLNKSLRSMITTLAESYIESFEAFIAHVQRCEDALNTNGKSKPSTSSSSQILATAGQNFDNPVTKAAAIFSRLGDKSGDTERAREEALLVARASVGSSRPFYGTACTRCGSKVHLKPKCPLKYEDVTCEYCGRQGHVQTACYEWKTAVGPKPTPSGHTFQKSFKSKPQKRTISQIPPSKSEGEEEEEEEGGKPKPDFQVSIPDRRPKNPSSLYQVRRVSVINNVTDIFPCDEVRPHGQNILPQIADATPMRPFHYIKRGDNEYVYLGKAGAPAPTPTPSTATIVDRIASVRIAPMSAMVSINIDGKPFIALADSGASVACIPKSKVPSGATILPTSGMIEVADGTRHEYLGATCLEVSLGEHKYPCNFHVVPNFMDLILLGANFFSDNDIVIDMRKGLIPPLKRPPISFVGNEKETDSAKSILSIHSCNLWEDTTFNAGETKVCRIFIEDGPKVEVDGLIDPIIPFTSSDQLSDPCVSAMGIISMSKEISVPVTNYHLYPTKMTAGTAVGMFTQLPRDCTIQKSWIPLTDPKTTHSGIHEFTKDIVPRLDTSIHKVSSVKSSDPSRGEFPNMSDSKELNEIIGKYKEAFYSKDRKLPCSTVIQHDITLNDNTPVFRPNFPLSHDDLSRLSMIVEDMVKNGWIEECTSDYNAPIVMVRKPNGEVRFCNDFRGLNSVTVQDRWSPPRSDEILMSLAGKTIFSKIDLKHGFYQIAIKPEHRHLTAFTAPNIGQYQYIRMPFGLMNAPATFCRLMHRALSGITSLRRDERVVSVIHSYIDDILIASESVKDHLAHIELLFGKLVEFKLSANPEKCSFLMKEVAFLGHLVSQQGVRPDPAKVETIRKRKPPENYKEVRSFLGLMGYYRTFIKDFTVLAAPLRELEAESQTFPWTTKEQEAFEKLKGALSEAVMKAHPDFNAPFIIHSDASDLGLGCALHQFQGDKEVPIAFGGRVLTPAEKRYSTSEKECLGLYFALKNFHPFIHMKKVVIKTDHRALQYLLTCKYSDNSRLRSWVNLIGVYLPEIHYIPGSALSNVDSISRQSYETSEPETILCNELAMAVIDADNNTISSQSRDPEIDKVRKALLAKESSDKYILLDGMVHRLVNGVPKLWVPPNQRRDLITEAHDGLFGGHRGEKVTMARLREDYWWVGMTTDIKDYIFKCTSCRTNKVQNPSVPHPSFHKTTSLGHKAFERIVMDVKGPVNKTKRGNRFLITFVDLASRWVEAFALRDHSAVTIARVLVEEIFTRHGAPSLIISDQGTEFMSHLFQEVMTLIGTNHQYNPAYTPWTQGAIERVHGSLSEILTHFIKNKESEWDRILPYALAAYRTAVHRNTGYAPFELLYGRKSNNPYNKGFSENNNSKLTKSQLADLLKPEVHNLNSAAKKWLLETKHNLSIMYETIAHNDEIARAINESKETPFRQGEYVLTLIENRPKSRWSEEDSPLYGRPSVVLQDIGNTLRLKDLIDSTLFVVNKRKVKRIDESSARNMLADKQETLVSGEVLDGQGQKVNNLSLSEEEDEESSEREEGEVPVQDENSLRKHRSESSQNAKSKDTTSEPESQSLWQSTIPLWASADSEVTLDGIDSPSVPNGKPDVRPHNCAPNETALLLSNVLPSLAENPNRRVKKAASFLGIHEIIEAAVADDSDLILWCSVYNNAKDWLTWVPISYFDAAKAGSKTRKLYENFLFTEQAKAKARSISHSKGAATSASQPLSVAGAPVGSASDQSQQRGVVTANNQSQDLDSNQ
jgi:hypothetical protein